MNRRLFDHLDLRVSDIAAARPLYDAFLPALGFTRQQPDGPTWHYGIAGDKRDTPFIELNEEPGYRGGSTRFAFWADTEEGVNRVGELARAAGAQNGGRAGILRRIHAGLLRGVFRGPRWQQVGNLLPHGAGALKDIGPAGI